MALEVSSFKCGLDAPIYGVIEGIIEQSGTPYFSFKDLDENKPSSSIRIRVETIDYFLQRYREDLIKRRAIEGDIEAQLAALEQTLRGKVALAGDQRRSRILICSHSWGSKTVVSDISRKTSEMWGTRGLRLGQTFPTASY